MNGLGTRLKRHIFRNVVAAFQQVSGEFRIENTAIKPKIVKEIFRTNEATPNGNCTPFAASALISAAPRSRDVSETHSQHSAHTAQTINITGVHANLRVNYLPLKAKPLTVIAG